MDFELTEEQKQIKSLLKQFCEREFDRKRQWELLDKAAKAAAVNNVEELRAMQPWDIVAKLDAITKKDIMALAAGL